MWSYRVFYFVCLIKKLYENDHLNSLVWVVIILSSAVTIYIYIYIYIHTHYMKVLQCQSIAVAMCSQHTRALLCLYSNIQNLCKPIEWLLILCCHSKNTCSNMPPLALSFPRYAAQVCWASALWCAVRRSSAYIDRTRTNNRHTQGTWRNNTPIWGKCCCVWKVNCCLCIQFRCWVVIDVFIIFNVICLFLIRLLSKVAGKGNTAEISVFYSGRHDTVINTPA